VTAKMDTLSKSRTRFVTATLDPFNQIIVATADGLIQRYDSLGQPTDVQYTNARLGAPSFIDATNPMQVLVYYDRFQLVKLLNRNLIEIATLDLNALGYSLVPVACAARDGNIWIFDALAYRFHKLDMQGRVVVEGAQVNSSTRANPIYLRDHGERLVACLDDQIIFEPTPFGQVHKMHRLSGRLRSFVSSDRTFTYVADSEIKVKGTTDLGEPFTEVLVSLPDLAGAVCVYLGKRICILHEKKGWVIVRV
jgi:hypothetical protein